MKLRSALLLLLLLACGKEAPAPKPVTPKPVVVPPPPDDDDRVNLLNFGKGAVVVSRTGEGLLETSALQAVDGDPHTYWMTPAGDVQQSIVVRLAAKSRIEKIGLYFEPKVSYPPHTIAFESSLDGRTFSPLGAVTYDRKAAAQWKDVTPVDAAYVRVTFADSWEKSNLVRVGSVLARGRELEPPQPPRIDGSWLVNGRPAAFGSTGARVTGTMQYAHNVMKCDGGITDRLVRLEWVRGPEFGYAAITADGEHLSGIEWHEEPIPLFFGDSWFGAKSEGGAAASAADDDVARFFLQRTGRHSLYALRFREDGSLDAEASAAGLAQLARLLAGTKGRLVAHEFREPNAQANRARAQREIDAIRRQLTPDELARVTFVAAGSDDPRQIPGSEAARELYSTVDLEVGR